LAFLTFSTFKKKKKKEKKRKGKGKIQRNSATNITTSTLNNE
jgi:hypothetical protein